MKKQMLTCVALAALSCLAHADDGTSLTIYGVVDAGYGYVRHNTAGSPDFPATVSPFGAVGKTTKSSENGLFNGGLSDSRIGFRGTEDLGDGTKAFFVLETGFDVTTGQLNNAGQSLSTKQYSTPGSSLNGQLFNRQATVGLSDTTLGTLGLGRQYAPEYDIIVAYDPLQGAQLFSPLGYSGTIGGGGGATEDARVDNSVKYTNKFGDFNYGGMYKAGNAKGAVGHGWALDAGYDMGPLGLQVAYQSFNDVLHGIAPATGVTTPLSGTEEDTRSFLLAAKYKVADDANLRAGLEHNVTKAATDPVAAATVENYYGISATTTALTGHNEVSNVYFFGGDYNFTSKFNLAAAWYSQHQLAQAVSSVSQKNGVIDTYSLLADYHFSKRTDTYAGVAYSKFLGTAYHPADWNSNFIVGAGLRVKF